MHCMDIINPVNNIITKEMLQIQYNYVTKIYIKSNIVLYELYKMLIFNQKSTILNNFAKKMTQLYLKL